MIYEIVCKTDQTRYVLFRTKNYDKAEAFCDIYNHYHNNIFDNGVIINTVDVSKIEKHADSIINKFKFMTEVDIADNEITEIKPVFIDNDRIKANIAVNELSANTRLFFDITDDIDEDKIWAAYEVANND